MSAERPRRPRPLPPDTIAAAVPVTEGTSRAEMLGRLAEALAELPPDERAAAVVSIALDEGVDGVAAHLGMSHDDADAVTRSALQLLRGRLADLDVDEPEVHGSLRERRPRHRPGPAAGPG